MSAEPIPIMFAPSPRGRRRDSMIPAKRRNRLDAARLIDIDGIEVGSVAKVFRRDVKTIYRWAAEGRTYPEYATLCRKAAAG